MDGSFVRTEPAQLRVIGQGARKSSESRHERFNFFSHQGGREKVDELANDAVPFAERQHHAGGGEGAVRVQTCYRQAVFRLGMDSVRTRSCR